MKREERKAQRYSNLFRLIRNYIFDTLCIDTIKYEYTYVTGWILTLVYFVSIGFRIVNRSGFHVLEIIVSLVIMTALIYVGRRFGSKAVNAAEEHSTITIQLTLEEDLVSILEQNRIDPGNPGEVEAFIRQIIIDHEKTTS